MDNPHLAASVTRWGDAGSNVTVLALHGRGQSPDELRALSERIGRAGVEWLAPSASERQWYPYRFMEPQAEDEPFLAWSLAAVRATLDAVVDGGRPLQRTVLLGFSQGACLLSEYVLTHPARYGGVVLLTGGYLGPDPRTFSGDLSGVPVLLATTEHDDWVPLARVHETEAELRRLGADTTLVVEPGTVHGVSDEAVDAVRGLLERLATADA